MFSVWLATTAVAVVPHGIRVEDPGGSPVPCVTLRTVDQQPFVTDAEGTIAVVDPGLLGREVWFTVEARGWTVPADFFGYRGVVLALDEGGSSRVVVTRTGAPDVCDAGDAASRILKEGLPAPFEIDVVDAVSGRGVPLVTVATPAGPQVTDSQGRIALFDPTALVGPAELTIDARHGYAPAARSWTPDLRPGGAATLTVIRTQPAERLYRITGRGIHRDSVLLGRPAPTADPVLDGLVMGQDSILVVPWQGAELWLWGDTLRPDYPLGLFDVAGAWRVPGLDPAEGVDLDYFVGPDGFARAMAPISGPGATWITAPAEVDDGGIPRLVAVYGKFESLAASERGLAVWDDTTEAFVRVTRFPDGFPELAHQVPVTRDGFVTTRDGFRFPATLAGASDPAAWEVFSPRLPDGTIDRFADGDARWAWRPLSPEVMPGALDPADDWAGHARDLPTGDRVTLHNGHVVEDDRRGRWVHVFTEQGGESWLGTIRYAEADTPLGPWSATARLATHDDLTFYNPLWHPELSDAGHLWFEGTLTTFFADGPAVPRYDYNQLMYRVAREDPDLDLPVPVYALGDERVTVRDLRPGDPEPLVAFFAWDRPADGRRAVAWDDADCAGRRLVSGVAAQGLPLFFVDAVAETGEVPFEDLGHVWPNEGPRHVPVLDWLPSLRVDAGPDVCVVAGPAGTATVSLQASATRAGSWSWTLDGGVVGRDAALTLRLPPGAHPLVVTFTDEAGVSRADGVWVHVDPAGAGPVDTGLGPEPAPTVPDARTPAGCGCASTGPGTGWVWVVVALAVAGRARAQGLVAWDPEPPPGGTQSVASCAGCHAEITEQWASSRHAVAGTNPTFWTAWTAWPNGWCVNCHAPLADGQRETLGGLAVPGGFPATAEPAGLWREGVSCAVCHLRDGAVRSATEPGPEALAAHPVVRDPDLASPALCATCHEFPLQRRTAPLAPFALGEAMAQETVSEWASSTAAADGVTCRSCHFGAAGHALPGAHDPDLVRGLLRVSVARDDEVLAFTVSAPGAAHRVPTGDPFRRLVLEVCADRACDEVLDEVVLGRVFRPEGDGWVLAEDRSLPPERPGAPSERVVWLAGQGARGWRLRYALADAAQEASLPADERGYVVHQGPVPR